MRDQLVDSLFIALCKIYDNYITPFNTKVKCWKQIEGNVFYLAMNILQFDMKSIQIGMYLPIELYDNINVLERRNQFIQPCSTEDLIREIDKI